MDPMDVDNTARHRRPPPPLRTPFGTPSATSGQSVPAHHVPHTNIFRQPSSPVNGTQSPFQAGTQSPFQSISVSMSPSAPSSQYTSSSNAATYFIFDPTAHSKIPDSIPQLTPSYPAALFGGLSADDEHVTVWEPSTGKTVAGNAAPYRRNLVQWLESHAGWEEKADELKSSKRRAAARRSKTAALNFAALCAFPIAKSIATDALRRFKQSGVPNPDKSLSNWSPEDYVRLQEILFRVAQEAYMKQTGADNNSINIKQGDNGARNSNNNNNGQIFFLPHDCWDRVAQHIGGSNKKATDIVYLAHHMLEFGIQKSAFELDAARKEKANGTHSGGGVRAIGIPGRGGSNADVASSPARSFDSGWRAPGSFGALSLPNMGSEGLSAITNSFRTPKEPRITVWHPATGKTISGNAAPCRRNLETWMKQHPGWQPKAETQLSSARRSRASKKKDASVGNSNNNNSARPMSVPTGAMAINLGGRNNNNTNSIGHSFGANHNLSHLSGNSLEGLSPQLEAAHGLLGLSTSFGSYNSSNGLNMMVKNIGNRNRNNIISNNNNKKQQMSSVSSSGADDVEEDEGDSTEDEDEEMEM